MIALNYHKQQIRIPSKWEDLSPGQYIAVADAMLHFSRFTSLTEFRLKVLEIVSGYKRSKEKYTEEEIEQINSNLLILSEMVCFPMRPYYPDPAVLEVLSDDLQAELQKTFPCDISNPDYLNQLEMVASMLQYSIQPAYTMKQNPLPLIENEDTKFYGPNFKIHPTGMVVNDILAREYILAGEYLNHFYSKKDEQFLTYLAGVLYRPARGEFDEKSIVERGELIDSWDKRYKYGALYFFENLLYFLSNYTKYGILFSKPDISEEKKSLGIDTIINLVKNGYGSPSILDNLPLDRFLEMLLAEVIDAVRTMRSYEKSEHEIATKLNLSPEILAEI